MPNAIELLKADHDKVRKLLGQLTETSSGSVKTREKLLEQIEKELTVHTQLEEEIFYPAFKDTDGQKNKEMYFESKEEHRAVEALVLPDLKNTKPDSNEFSGRAKVLKELVEHHAKEEEQNMFPQAKKCFSEAELKELGEKIEQRKKELQ